MLVKLLEGRLAGQVVNMAYHRAAPLLEQGRVIDVRTLTPEVQEPQQEVEPPRYESKKNKRNLSHADTRTH